MSRLVALVQQYLAERTHDTTCAVARTPVLCTCGAHAVANEGRAELLREVRRLQGGR